jgi:hypothetical protein
MLLDAGVRGAVGCRDDLFVFQVLRKLSSQARQRSVAA